MTPDLHDNQSRLQEVIADYLEAVDAGRSANREHLLAQHPALAEDLREFFAAHDELGQIAAPTINISPAPAAPAVAPGEVTFALAHQPTGGNGRLSPARPPKEVVGYFGDYELLDEIARGGMGVVYKARQANLDRTVALKMILTGQLASEEGPTDIQGPELDSRRRWGLSSAYGMPGGSARRIRGEGARRAGSPGVRPRSCSQRIWPFSAGSPLAGTSNRNGGGEPRAPRE